MAKKRRRKMNEGEKRVLKFFIKFNLFAIPLYILLAINFDFLPLQRAVADITMFLLHNAGISASRDGLLISIPVEGGNWGGFINSDCVGWKSMLAFAALVMATDFPARKKLMGLALVPVIFAANLVRIFFMFFYVSSWGLAGYEFVHAVVWTWGLLFIVIAVWIWWARLYPK
ncbi:MAG: archaeosortase/exosortase family protein [Candidatus Aenigmarchaeota archaeon]|nr:archaeosortase/exosortase family protein [Candidatus Aenigmarchaeota archaeon]